MAILQSIDGRYYQVPDEELAQYKVSADQIGELLKQAGVGAPAGKPQPAAAGQVQAYSHRGEHEWHEHEGHRPWFYSNYYNYSNYSNYSNFSFRFGW